jgi:nicotinate-nucleotide pyrophosphorylase (carboxylating)
MNVGTTDSPLAPAADIASNPVPETEEAVLRQPASVDDDIARALAEDVGDGDLSAAAIPADRHERARVIARAPGVVCGRPWFDGVFRAVDPRVAIDWHVDKGTTVAAETALCSLKGPARALFTAERSALNFLQLLSGVATATRAYVDAVAGTDTAILDTRKTLPGLRQAQKYAVACGGGANHRMGLFDAAMLKENHLHAAGGITAAVAALRAAHPEAPLTIEVETLEQVREALVAGADRLLLDNFSPANLRTAVAENAGRAWLEASGGITLENVRAVAETGVDCISIGALTKDIQALDLSMRFAGDGLSGGNAPTGGA